MALTERIRRIFSAILSPHFLGREQEALVEMAGASLDEAQDMIDEGIQGVQAQIDDLHSEYGAGLIGIEDQDDNFTSTNVEGALKELAERDISEEDVDVTGNWSFHSPITFVDGPYSGSLGASLTDDRAYTLPDASGTIALLADIPAQVNLIAGSNINISGTYPNLTISGTGGGGGTGVSTVNGMVGDVVLTYSDVGAAPASHTHTIAQVTGLQSALNGKANTSHTHAAADITSGIIARARLGTGTADSDTYLRGDGTWATPDTGTGGGGGTVTRVQVAGGTGLTFTGGPITTTGTITGTLSTNLQGWSGIAPSSKANTNGVVTTTGNQTGLAGNKTWTGTHTFEGTVTASNLVETGRTISAGNGLSGGGSLAANRTISMGTPAAVTLSSTNSVGTSDHTHAFSPGGTTSQYIRGNGTLATFPSIPSGTVTSVSGGSGLTGSVTSSGSIALGTPGTITGSTSNAVQTNSHTHALTLVAGDIPNLNASKITAGTFAAARIPDLSSSYVATSGDQSGISGNKTFTGNLRANAYYGASFRSNSGSADLAAESSGDGVRLMPNGYNTTGMTHITGNGNMSVGGTVTATNVTATSDVRLKEEVEESRGRQELLNALRHYRWKWKSSGNPGIGVLAQEVKKHAPEYVHEDDEGTLSVDKAGLALEMMFALIDKLEVIDGTSD